MQNNYTNMEIINKYVFEIYNIYLSENGVKPNESEIINLNDDIDIKIFKFINWYNRIYEFATYDPRDFNGFLSIRNKFINTQYKNYLQNHKYKTEIEDNIFLKTMIEYIISDSPSYIILPDYIINLKNIKINNNQIFFNILNMNGEIILSNLQFNFPFELKLFIQYIFINIQILKKLNNIKQLKILYNNELVDDNIINILLKSVNI